MRRAEGRRNVPPALCSALLVKGKHPCIVAGLGGAAERWCCLQLHVERAGRGMECALDLALPGVLPHLPLKYEPRPDGGPVRTIARVLRPRAVANKVQALNDDQVPGVRLAPARHRVDGGAVTLARAVRDDLETVPRRDLKSPRVLLLLSAVHCVLPSE